MSGIKKDNPGSEVPGLSFRAFNCDYLRARAHGSRRVRRGRRFAFRAGSDAGQFAFAAGADEVEPLLVAHLLDGDDDPRLALEGPAEQLLGERILDVGGNAAAQRPGTI